MRKNVASQVVGAQMVSATDGAAFTGSVTVHVTGDGGTQATGSVGSGACTHEGNGFHTYAPAQAETNYDHVAFTFIGTGAVPATVQIYTSFPQTGDGFARLGAPAGASVSADIAAIEAQTDDIGALGAGLTALASAADLATLASYVDTEVAAIKAKTDNLPSDPADASVIAGRFDTLDTSVADLPTNAELATALGTADDAVLTQVAALATLVGDLPTNSELATALAGADDATLAAIAALVIPTANQIADAYLDRTNGIETGLTPRQHERLVAAVLYGKASGLATTTANYRDVADSKNRITATVDADGNRSAVTRDAT